MNLWASRFVILVGLTPLIVVAFILTIDLPTALRLFPAREGQIACILSTIIFCVPAIFLFRRTSRRGARGKWESSVWTMILGIQLCIFQPMWKSTNCANEDILVTGQSLSLTGLWLAAFIGSWFGLRFIFRRPVIFGFLAKDGTPMNQATLRLIIAYALIPFLPGLFFICWVALDDFTSMNSNEGWGVSFIACTVVAIAAWVATWRNAIQWTVKRRIGTMGLATLFLLSALPILLMQGLSSSSETYLSLIPLIAFSIWLIGTSLLWREKNPAKAVLRSGVVGTNTADRGAENLLEFVHCPKCNYSMKGLREVKCPECGWNSTIDDLFEKTVTSLLNQP